MNEAPPHHELPADFERELGRQILRSEKLRAAIVAGTGGAIIVIVSVAAWIMHVQGDAFRGWQWSCVIAAGGIVYELITRRIFDHFLRHDRQPPRIARFGNAAVETSIPTIILLMLASVAEPGVAMASAAPFSYFFFVILSALRLDFWLSAFTGMVAAAGHAGVTLYFREELHAFAGARPELMMGHVVRPLMLLIGGVVAGLVASRIRAGLVRSLQAVEDRRRVVQMFGEHVSPAVVNQLLSQPRGTHSEVREVCVLVLDVRDFTSFSEHAAPDDVVAYLNRLWGSAVRIVNERGGIVNKFLGDGFLAIFGAPLADDNRCGNALAAARELLDEIGRASGSGEIPPTRVGIGLHMGPALVGNIGSSERREYTVIGDVVNVAFRIEQMNKQLGSALLVSEAVRQAVPGVEFTATPLSLAIRGRQQPVQVYRLA